MLIAHVIHSSGRNGSWKLSIPSTWRIGMKGRRKTVLKRPTKLRRGQRACARGKGEDGTYPKNNCISTRSSSSIFTLSKITYTA